MTNPICNTCGQEMPHEPVYVGPGDRVKVRDRYRGHVVTVIALSPLAQDCVVVQVEAVGCVNVMTRDITGLDGRPVAGFRDPRDERIKELELQAMQDVSKSFVFPKALTDRIAELEDELATTREALADERLNSGTWQEAYNVLLENREAEQAEANPLAGLSDERLRVIAKKRHEVWANGYGTTLEMLTDLFRDLRDGKLEVPR